MDLDKISLTAQTIIFAFEDLFHDEKKKNKFVELFEKYLSPLDPAGRLEPYDAIIKLGRKNPSDFDQMVKEMQDAALIK
jgi:hypothetical protein